MDRPREVGGYSAVKAALSGRPAAHGRTARLTSPSDPAGSGRSRKATPRIEAPSTRQRSFQQRDGFFSITYPANWRVHEAESGYGVVIAPDGGIGSVPGRSQEIVYGVVINHYEPFDRRGRGTLEEATGDLVGQIRQGSPYLRASGTAKRETVDGARGMSLVLLGRNPATGGEERVSVLTRELADDHVLYALFVVPRQDFSELGPVFERMMDSLRVNDRMAHR